MVKLIGHLHFPDFHVYMGPVTDSLEGTINYPLRLATFFWKVAKDRPDSLF